MGGAYYNEFEPYAAQWLRNLIAAGHIAPGDVDERSITEVKSDDLNGYDQCHFFAGIGGWSHALRLAGWDDSRPVWTGSCPCQPFSTAGRQEGHADERHLWPHWFRLIRECRPATVFGEQVAGAIAFGWLDEVFNDLENEAYSCAAAILPACSVGRPHKRDRLWFVGDSEHDGRHGGQVTGGYDEAVPDNPQRQDSASQFTGASQSSNVADSDLPQCETEWLPSGIQEEHNTARVDSSDVADPERIGQPRQGGAIQPLSAEENNNGQANRADSDCEWLECPDGKTRAVKSGLCIVANGVPARVGRLRAYGNAIVPQVAAEFIKSYMEITT